MTPSPGDSLIHLLQVFDRLEIPYMIGGSGASSVHGLTRTTADIDIVARIALEQVAPLITALQQDFYIDEGQVRSALEHARSFNVIHYRSSYKFDIFPLTSDRYQQAQFERRRNETSTIFSSRPLELVVATAEDIILSKLHWFQKGGQVSEQQWNDVLGVVSIQAEKLNQSYLREWAEYLGISQLLERALAEGRGR